MSAAFKSAAFKKMDGALCADWKGQIIIECAEESEAVMARYKVGHCAQKIVDHLRL